MIKYANSQTTDLDQHNMRKVEYFSNTNIDSLLFYSEEMLKSKEECIVVNGKVLIANVHYKKGDYDASEKKIYELLSEIESKDSFCQKRNKINALNRLFWIKKNQNKYNEALSILIRREKIVESIKEKGSGYIKYRQDIVLNLAAIKQILGFNREAIQILKNSLNKEYSYINNKESINSYHYLLANSHLNNMIGDSHLILNQLDSAKIYYQKAFKITEKINPKHEDSEALYNLRLAKVLLKGHQYKKGIELINRYDFNPEKYNTKQNINFLKSFAYHNLTNNDSSIYYGKQFLNYKKKSPGAKKNRTVIYNILADEYYRKNRLDSAYKYSDLALVALDTIIKSKSDANKSHYLYDFKKVKDLNERIIKKDSERKIYLILLLSISAVLITIVGYYLHKKKKQNLEAIEENIPIKKEYNIDETLERKILNGLDNMEVSRNYLDSNFTIQILAKKLGTNVTYVSTIVNNKKGKSFKQYITELRINYLIQQLKDNPAYRRYTIKALGEEIGYTNASAFTRAFKKSKNQTPSEFLNSL